MDSKLTNAGYPSVEAVTAAFDDGSDCSGISWIPLSSGKLIPKNALRAGWTKADGPTYIGRLDGQIGKINTDLAEEPHMSSFWRHGLWTKRGEAEILVCVEGFNPTWQSLGRTERVPPKAIMSCEDRVLTRTKSPTGMPEEVRNVMVKLGAASKKGAIYVGRFNGEPGALEAKEGSMRSFWGHHWGEQKTAEVLILEPCDAPPRVQTVDSFLTVSAGIAPAVAPWRAEMDASLAVSANPTARGSPLSMRILQFNIWQEGWEVSDGLNKIADVILASGADVVALSEVRNWSARNMPIPYSDFHVRLKSVLTEKAKARHDDRTDFYACWVEGCDSGLVSRWPIETIDSLTVAKRSFIAAYHIQTPAGRVCVCSAHLDWKCYALNLVRGYDADTFSKLPSPVTDVEALFAMDARSGRSQALQDFEKYAKAQTCPVILAGDFNECSHLDWTKAAQDMYGHAGVAIEWAQSKFLMDAGFRDSWRELFPDPATHMGATWPSHADGIACTSWAKEADERDRIDFIYYCSARLRPIAGHIVGNRSYFVKGQPADCTCQSPFLEATLELPWPSDHKAVLVEFEFSPA